MDLPMARQRDWNALMRAVLLLALTAFVVRLVRTGEIAMYIHPKFTWFTASSAVGLSLMAVGQLVRGLGTTTGPVAPMRTRLYLAFTAVLCVGFLVRPVTFGADLALKQGMNITQRTDPRSPAAASSVPASAAPAPTPASAAPPPSPAPAAPPPTGKAEPPADAGPAPLPPAGGQLRIEGDTIIVTTQNFAQSMAELYGNEPAKYAGKRVSLEGFVFYPPETKSDEFAITRLVVTCHVAHAFPDGLLVYNQGQERPAQDLWFRMEGVIEPVNFQGTDTIRVRMEKLTPIPQPADPYVYP